MKLLISHRRLEIAEETDRSTELFHIIAEHRNFELETAELYLQRLETETCYQGCLRCGCPQSKNQQRDPLTQNLVQVASRLFSGFEVE